MTSLQEQDDLAKLAYALANGLSREEGKEAVAAMYGLSKDMAWALIVRGKTLAKGKVA